MTCLYKNRDWLYEHYVVLQESTYVMAQKAECSQYAIWYRLHKFNIPVRSRSEGNFLAQRNYLNLSTELSDLLEGELLGDGYIGIPGSRSARYTHTSKYREYLEWLSKTFADMGLEQVGKILPRWYEEYHCWSYSYQSRLYPELVPMQKKWYPDGKKIVPKDLVLTPIMARQWYIGDGGINLTNWRPYIDFSTYAFDKASIDHLLEELRGKGFRVNHWPASNTIGMSVESVKDFLDWIGPCPISCYQYKWDYQDNRRNTAK